MDKTIHDVARAAGVGIGTVSRVINNNPGVKPATRAKVLAAVAQLNYRPNLIARSMISKRTDAIGVIVPFFTRPFNVEMLRGIETALGQRGKDLVLYNVETDNQRDHYLTELPTRHRVDGLLILSLPVPDTFAFRFKETGMPAVLIDAYSSLLTSLVVNNVEGSYQAVHYLIEKGHHRIGFINGIIEGNFKFNQANDRLIGLHRALGEANIPFEPELVVTSGWNWQEGRQAALQLLSLEKRPTAIFAASDMQAIGVLEAARSLHMNVPGDLSVIGYDGIEISELLELTTMQQPMMQMGELGVQKLLGHIENSQKPSELVRLNATLIERGTTKEL